MLNWFVFFVCLVAQYFESIHSAVMTIWSQKKIITVRSPQPDCVYLIAGIVRVSGQLKANNGQLMEDAVQAMQNLAQQCSDPSAVEDIVTHLFKILGGKVIYYPETEIFSGFFSPSGCSPSWLLWLQVQRESSQLLPKRSVFCQVRTL